MAQQDLRNRDAVTEVGLETTFGIASGTPSRIFPVGDSFDGTRERTELDVDDESVYPQDYKDPVEGLKDGGLKLDLYAKPDAIANQLLTAATPAATPLGVILKAAFGGETMAAGSLVTAASTATEVNVTAASGTRFAVGQWILVGVGGVLEPGLIASIATDALTLAFPLSGAPATGQLVVNMFNRYFTPTNTQTLTFSRALAADTNEQHQWLGCIVEGLEYKIARNTEIVMSPQIKAATWIGPTSGLVSSTAFAADTMGKPFVAGTGYVYLQDASLSTRPTPYRVFDFKMKVMTGMVLTEDHGGGVNGYGGAMRLVTRPAAEITIQVPADQALMTLRNARTHCRLTYVAKQGSTTAIQYWLAHAPQAVPVGEPKIVNQGGRRLYEQTFKCAMNPTGATDLARSALVLADG